MPEQVIDPVTGQPVVAAVPQDKREQAVRNYELDRQISHTRQQLGRLKRLSVAVVVDDPAQVDPQTGEVTRTPISEAEMARLTRLVQDAVGYDASRGDSVSVICSNKKNCCAVEVLIKLSHKHQMVREVTRLTVRCCIVCNLH